MVAEAAVFRPVLRAEAIKKLPQGSGKKIIKEDDYNVQSYSNEHGSFERVS